jgi:excinuclease UvrABC helicase subunit UvrB
VDHRPLAFEEVQTILRWNRNEWDNSNSSKSTGVETISHSNILLKHIWLEAKIKSKSKTMFVSATPAIYEFEHSKIIAEQVIRPTWLLDPVTYIYPTSWDYELLMKNFSNVMKKKPFLEKYLTSYDHTQLTEIFDDQAEGFDSVSSDT